jgi:catechol 2,3-dioxygenase-like lactoylglutathione lyase family enzyme
MSKPALTDTIIELHVPDFSKVKDFYRKLGFEQVWEYEPKGQGGYLVMKRERSVLAFFCGNEEVYNHPFFKKFPKSTPRGYGVEIVIYVSDEPLEDFYKSIIENIGQDSVIEELKTQPWRSKDFRIIDPFGFYLRFSEPENILLP